jgi:hypothetical protein
MEIREYTREGFFSCHNIWAVLSFRLGFNGLLTIRDYLRHSNLSVTNKYLQAASKAKRNAQARLVEAILPVHLRPAGKTAETVAPLLRPDSKSGDL